MPRHVYAFLERRTHAIAPTASRGCSLARKTADPTDNASVAARAELADPAVPVDLVDLVDLAVRAVRAVRAELVVLPVPAVLALPDLAEMAGRRARVARADREDREGPQAAFPDRNRKTLVLELRSRFRAPDLSLGPHRCLETPRSFAQTTKLLVQPQKTLMLCMSLRRTSMER